MQWVGGRILKVECLPRGCLSRGVSAQGVVCLGVYTPRPRCRHPQTQRQTPQTQMQTLPRTQRQTPSFANITTPSRLPLKRAICSLLECIFFYLIHLTRPKNIFRKSIRESVSSTLKLWKLKCRWIEERQLYLHLPVRPSGSAVYLQKRALWMWIFRCKPTQNYVFCPFAHCWQYLDSESFLEWICSNNIFFVSPMLCYWGLNLRLIVIPLNNWVNISKRVRHTRNEIWNLIHISCHVFFCFQSCCPSLRCFYYGRIEPAQQEAYACLKNQ